MQYALKDFAALTGKKAKDLYIYRKRRQLAFDEAGIIDTENEINLVFLEKYCMDEGALLEAQPAGREFDEEDTEGSEFDEDDLDSPEEKEAQRSFIASERAKVHFQAKKLEFEQEIKEIELAKKKGLLIPTALVGGLITQFSKSMTATFRQAAEKMVDLMIVKYKLSPADAAEMRKVIVDAVNKSITDGLADTKKRIKSIVAEEAGKAE